MQRNTLLVTFLSESNLQIPGPNTGCGNGASLKVCLIETVSEHSQHKHDM